MQKVLLTISIPTYKRRQYVVENVQHLLPQLLAHQDEARLIVTDNHSEDGTYEALQPIAQQYPALITIYEQEENIGWMNNFFFGIERADSDYVYLLGDDDIVSPDFLDIVLPILRKSDERLGMLHFNYIKGPVALNKESLLYPDFKNAEMIVRYTDTYEFVTKFNTGPSFISSVIFRKDCMLKGKAENLQPSTFGYSWFLCLYTGIVGYDVLYYKMPLVVQRLGGFYPGYCFNYVIGMYNVYKYLDPYVPGVKTFWEEEFAKQHDTIAMNLNQIIEHRDMYLAHYDLFTEALPDKQLKEMLHVALRWPKFWAKKYFKIYWIYSKYFKS